MFCISYILLYYNHNHGSLKNHILSHNFSGSFVWVQFNKAFCLETPSRLAVQVLARAVSSSEMSAGEGPILKAPWLLAEFSSLLVVRLRILVRCWISAGSCPLIVALSCLCIEQLAACFTKRNKVKNLLVRCKSEFCIVHSWTYCPTVFAIVSWLQASHTSSPHWSAYMKYEYQDMVFIQDYLPQFSSNNLLFRTIYLLLTERWKRELEKDLLGKKRKVTKYDFMASINDCCLPSNSTNL